MNRRFIYLIILYIFCVSFSGTKWSDQGRLAGARPMMKNKFLRLFRAQNSAFSRKMSS